MPVSEPSDGGLDFDVPVMPTVDDAQGGTLLPVPYVSQNPAKNLCWAACCEMALRANNVTSWTLSTLAALFAVPGTSCSDATAPGCDVAQKPEDAYGRLEFHFSGPFPYPFTWQALVNEISTARRPVEALLHWDSNGESHAVLLIGLNNQGYVFVNDPLRGWGWVAYDDVKSAYGLGFWAFSYQEIGYSLGALS